ncbi:hypothetical protein EIN_345940 [Entamoeba invadens IP1]|uniref:EGF-like domain-containing protein n=1 Tax=Entamoeba invadens IP1 TaxID=370355 RepID=L7FJV7_ENTIV|nr:hypothetical protein EIN_345940 [Entamoeba invadens IP1]ELP84008.1 hypothetical protein EIN_345940 [Entamoeba invadens IP1]|eukprot:XP_004183354.1 hypothetical protein EIN_345940 [Entamoeba invadens IP1]
MYFFALISAVFSIDLSCDTFQCNKCEEGKCVNCEDGYLLQDGKCLFGDYVMKHCKTFKNNKCFRCYNGYHIYHGKCIKNELACKEYHKGHCKVCHKGYTLQDDICKKCEINGCTDCDGNIKECKWCNHEFILSNNTCIQTIIGCDTYVNPLFAKSPCLECRDIYFLENGTCQKMDFPNCMSVTKGKTCGMCYDPYTLNSDGLCAKTVERVPDYSNFNRYVRCEMLKLKIPECTKCPQNEFLSNKSGEFKCEKCSEESKTTCEGRDFDSCRQCNDDCSFVEGKCALTHCHEHSLLYDSVPSKCIRCKKGFIMKDIEFCVESDGCETLEGEKCVQCKTEFYLGEDYKCHPCDEKCKGCTHNSTTCTSCVDDYTIRAARSCELCSDKACAFCEENKGICTQCYSGYTLNEFGQCESSCFESDGKECTSCRDLYDDRYKFYKPVNGKCLRYSEVLKLREKEATSECVGETCTTH